MREQLKKEIREKVTVIDTASLDYTNVTEYKDLARGNIWNDAIQKAIDEKKNVYIPDMGGEIFIDESIFLDSGCNLKVEKGQVINLCPGINTCMIRNRNIIPGNAFYVEQTNPDEYITVSGGVWKSEGNRILSIDKFISSNGGFSHFQFSNINHLNITDVVFAGGAPSYAVQIGNCHDFYVNNIEFYNHRKDGVHVDGPSSYGIISNLSGSNLGDDMVAILAWDWCGSAVTFGDIEKILVENVTGDSNELRLLAGRKEYPNKKTHDCAVRNCVIENVSGIYTYKMYYQPNCANITRGRKDFDSAETVGEMTNIFYKDISFPCLKESGFNDIPVYGLFDILADCENIHFENIKVEQSVEALDEKGIKLINAGPISAPWKMGDDPKLWGELFDADACCTVKDIHLKNITFDGNNETQASRLVKETQQKPNPDYPKLGGTGYGKIEKIEVE